MIVGRLIAGTAVSLLLVVGSAACAALSPDTESILAQSGLRRPGLCIHVGCTDGRLESELAESGTGYVEGLCFDGTRVRTIRTTLRRNGVSGKTTVLHLAGKKLPYPDNFVNLIVADDVSLLAKQGITPEEMVRVLAPYGTLLVKGSLALKGLRPSGGWNRLDKPYPAEMDEWNQERHDAGRTSISGDSMVGPPNSLRWIAGERWTNEGNWGYSSMLSAGGRVFYRQSIETEYGFRNRTDGARITARDAFNGTLLWQRDFTPDKYNKMAYPMLVAEGNLHLPGQLVNASTGEGLPGQSYAGYPYAGYSYLAGYFIQTVGRAGVVEAATGEVLWASEEYVRSAVSDGKLVFQLCERKQADGTRNRWIKARQLKTGEVAWENADCSGSLFCCRDGVIMAYSQTGREMGANHAYSSDDGAYLWSFEYDLPGHGGRPFVFVAGGLAWVHAGDNEQKYPKGEKWIGLDLKTGAISKTIPMVGKVKHRCYRHRATEKYILFGGIDLLDVGTTEIYASHGMRGGCSAGYIPANGLLYGMPTVCECFAHLRGFAAVAKEDSPTLGEMDVSANSRLVRGPGSAWGATNEPAATQWPAYRHDAQLSGATTAAVSSELRPKWEQRFTSRISAPVVSDGRVLVSEIDTHTIVALDTATGKQAWEYSAGGRADTPPTISGELAVFGAGDGWVYALVLSSGELAWKFRAAPNGKRILSRGQLESAWPLSGSLPVSGGNVYAAAGRHDEFDGGIFLYCLRVDSGDVVWETRVQRLDLFKQVSRGEIGNEMNDILRTDGETVYMNMKSFSAASGEPSEPKGMFLWGGTAGWLDDQTIPPYTWKHDFQRARQLRSENRKGRSPGSIVNYEAPMAYVIYSDNHEIYCSPGKGKYPWKYAYEEPQCPRSMAVTGNALFVPAMHDSDDLTKGEIWVIDKATGALTNTIPLPSAPSFEGIAAVEEMLFVCTEDNRLVAFGE